MTNGYYCQQKGIVCSLATEFGYCKVTACINNEVKNMRTNIKLKRPITDIEFDLDENSIEANGYYISKWVSCSERLPSEDNNLKGFLTTVKCYDDTYDVFISVYENGKFGCWDGGKLMPDENVVAWMELPEPYKEEKENNQ